MMLNMEAFDVVLDLQVRQDLISFISSKDWNPVELRESLTNNFPDIINSLTFNLAAAIDQLAFSYNGGYWGEAYGFPEVGQHIIIGGIARPGTVIWTGAFTIDLI